MLPEQQIAILAAKIDEVSLRQMAASQALIIITSVLTPEQKSQIKVNFSQFQQGYISKLTDSEARENAAIVDYLKIIFRGPLLQP